MAEIKSRPDCDVTRLELLIFNEARPRSTGAIRPKTIWFPHIIYYTRSLLYRYPGLVSRTRFYNLSVEIKSSSCID